jgi:lipid-A-disaccharide synthase
VNTTEYSLRVSRGLRPRIFISGGEISGDRQASHLARHLLLQNGDARLYGCGGDNMRAAGVDVRVQTAHLGYVGLQESLRFRRPIREAHRSIARLLKEDRPDLAVLVDGEHFNRFLMSHLHREGIPFIYYFVPQVWFWGRWRTRGIARSARLVIPAFPAEIEIFRSAGARVEWFGHPLVDIVRSRTDAARTLVDLGLNPTGPIVGLLPGSRTQEIENFGPRLLAAARLLEKQQPELQFILPVAAPHLRAALTRQIAEAGLAHKIRLITSDVYTCLSQCQVVLLSSGTATLETALLGVPMVVFYSVKAITYLVAQRMITSRFIAMPNILLNELVVPELIQEEFTVERMVAEALGVLRDPQHASDVRQKLARVRTLLGKPGVLERAARLVLREAGWIAPSSNEAPCATLTVEEPLCALSSGKPA